MPDLHAGPVILRQEFLLIVFRKLHVRDQDQFLPVIVEADDLVKQHQIHVFESLRILCVQIQSRLCIFQIVIREISHQASGEGRKAVYLRARILQKDLSDIASRIFRLYLQSPCPQQTILAADLQFRVIAEKCVAPPVLMSRHRFQHIYMA